MASTYTLSLWNRKKMKSASRVLILALVYLAGCTHHIPENSETPNKLDLLFPAAEPTLNQSTVGFVPHSTKGFYCTAIFCASRKDRCEVLKRRVEDSTDCAYQPKAACFDRLKNSVWIPYCYTEMKWCQALYRKAIEKDVGKLQTTECSSRDNIDG